METGTFMKLWKKVFEPITDTVIQASQQAIGAVKDTTKAIELKGEKSNKAIYEREDFINRQFWFRLLEPLSEVINSDDTSQFQLR